MSTEQTQQAMQGYLDMLVKRGAYGQYFTDDCVFVLMGPRQETKGKQAVEQFIRYFHEQAFDAEPQVKTLLCGDGQAALEAVFHGTHTGEFLGVSATGRLVDVPYTVFYELRGDKISMLRGYIPMDVLIGQLKDPAPEPA
jgi:predicted ester cyclase